MFNFLSFMWVLYLALAGSAFILSLLIWVQSSKGKKTQRAMFHKRAIQNTKLLSLVFLLMFIVSMLDLFLGGPVKNSVPREALLYFVFVPFFGLLGFLFSRLWYSRLRQKSKPGFPWLWALLSIWASLKSMSCLGVTTLFGIHKISLIPYTEIWKPDFSSEFLNNIVVFYNTALQIFFSLTSALPLLTMIIWVAFMIVLGLAFSYALAGLYCLSRRSADDYGRDYYQLAIKDYTKSAFITSLMLLAGIFAIIAMNPQGFLNMGQNLVMTFNLNPETTWLNIAAWASCSLLLLPPVFYGLVSKSQNPMRFKTLVVLTPFILIVGTWAIMPLFS